MNRPARLVCHFSCGAASAVATKICLAADPTAVIVNAEVAQEHPDNRRFLADCQRWFGQAVIVLRDEKYGASPLEVFRRERFIKGRYGAPCTRLLKRKILDAWSNPGDVAVLGFTIEERDRFEEFVERSGIEARAPLIEHGLTKSDCLAMVERAGIQLPVMYRLGYSNANCIGCVKGGEGYWNKVRRDFPEVFEATATVQADIGPGANFFRERKTGVRFSLRELDPSAGRHDEVLSDCSFFCTLAEVAYLEAGT